MEAVADELRSALNHPSPGDELFTSLSVGKAPLGLLPLDPQSVIRLAYWKLHSFYPFSQVPTYWRRCYEEACLWAILQLLEQCPKSALTPQTEDEVIQLCDNAIIMSGAPGRRRLIDLVLRAVDEHSAGNMAGILSYGECKCPDGSHIEAQHERDAELNLDRDECRDECRSESERPHKKARLQSSVKKNTRTQSSTSSIPSTFPKPLNATANIHRSSHPVPRIRCPSLALFGLMLSKSDPTPAIITDSLDHWPALSLWKDPRYWLRQTHQGRRRVPVEWGKSYVDEGWGQSIVPFGQFLRDELLNTKTEDALDGAASEPSLAQPYSRKGYLAQHDLLAQIPALRNDIAVPDYCYCSADDDEDDSSDFDVVEPLLNIWLGPADTVSPAHTDPHHNLLAQVTGRKYVRLFSPTQTPHMYPMKGNKENGKDAGKQPGYSMANTSSVDVGLEVTQLAQSHLSSGYTNDKLGSLSSKIDLQRQQFPLFHTNAEYVECVLEAGEMLFIPRGWWHYIRSLEVSCNVSFWWD